jgi:hypothetical protein
MAAATTVTSSQRARHARRRSFDVAFAVGGVVVVALAGGLADVGAGVVGVAAGAGVALGASVPVAVASAVVGVAVAAGVVAAGAGVVGVAVVVAVAVVGAVARSADGSVPIVTSYRMIDRNDHTWADWVRDMVYACFPCGEGFWRGGGRGPAAGWVGAGFPSPRVGSLSWSGLRAPTGANA